MESNPGPVPMQPAQPAQPAQPNNNGHDGNVTSQILTMTHNVRGLNDEKKLRHLLSHCHGQLKSKDTDYIACLQETYIESPGKIPFLWRGNFHLTPGNGNSCGCITLLSPHISIVANRNLRDRAHVLACQRTGENKVGLIIANVYAPNPNNLDKINFFEEFFELLREMEDTYDCANTLVLGDFNLNFKASEMKNRNYTSQEKRVAASVRNLMVGTGLTDIWKDSSEFTWRRPNSDIFSTIDRILYTKEKLRITKLKTNWSLSLSDHAAVEVCS